MKVRIKKLSERAVVPSYAHTTDAGLDLTAVTKTIGKGVITYGTGIAVEIPEGYVGFVFPRSSVYKTYLDLTNCVGVIDSGYRGEIKMVYRNVFNVVSLKGIIGFLRTHFGLFKTRYVDANVIVNYDPSHIYNIGERIGQLIILPYPKIEFEEVEELSQSDRGTDGYGSTGK